MFWRSPKGLIAVVPTTAILSYILLMQISKEPEGPMLRRTSGSKQLSAQQEALDERGLAAALKNPASGPRLENGREPWLISGWVRDEKGKPLAQVRIQVGADKAGLHRHVGYERTDEKGYWSLSLDAIKSYSAAFRNESRIRIRFQAQGHPRVDRYLEMPGLSTKSYTPRIAVELGGGIKIAGRVLDRRRKPVSEAGIYLSGPEQRGEYFERIPRTETDSFGRFEIFVRNSGQHELEVFKAGIGSSKRQTIRVRQQEDIHTPDIFIGSGVGVGGVVQYEDGTPVTSAFLIAQIAPTPVGRPTRHHADKIEEVRFWTDPVGRFRLDGLESGKFAVGDRIKFLDGFATLLRTEDPVARVVVHRQRLRIKVKDREGWSLPGSKVHVAVWTGKNVKLARDTIRDMGDLDPLLDRASRREFLRLHRKTGNLDLWVERGSYCWIRLAIPGCLPISRGILLDPRSNESDLTIVVQNR